MTSPQPQEPAPQVVYVEAPKKSWYKRPGCIIPLVLVVLLLIFMGGCAALFGKVANDVSNDLDREYEVTYVMEGDFTNGLATYNSGDTDTLQDSNLSPGWQKTVKVKGLFGAYLDASDLSLDDSTTTITCKIISGGKIVAENTANSSAACSASGDQLKEAVK